MSFAFYLNICLVFFVSCGNVATHETEPPSYGLINKKPESSRDTFINPLEKNNLFEYIKNDGAFFHFEGVFGSDNASLFLNKIISYNEFYVGFLYIGNNREPILLKGNEEFEDTGGGIDIDGYLNKMWSEGTRKKKLLNETIVLRNFYTSVDDLGVKYLLEGKIENNNFEGYNTNNGNKDKSFKFTRQKSEIKFELTLADHYLQSTLRKDPKNDSTIVEAYFNFFLIGGNESISKEIKKTVSQDWIPLSYKGKTKGTLRLSNNFCFYDSEHENLIVYDKQNIFSTLLFLGENSKTLNYVRGKKISLSDIFNSSDTSQVSKLLHQKALNKIKNLSSARNGIEEIASLAVVNDNFNLTGQGLLFNYPSRSHELIRESFGNTGLQVFVSFNELSGLIKPSFLKQLYRLE